MPNDGQDYKLQLHLLKSFRVEFNRAIQLLVHNLQYH